MSRIDRSHELTEIVKYLSSNNENSRKDRNGKVILSLRVAFGDRQNNGSVCLRFFELCSELDNTELFRSQSAESDFLKTNVMIRNHQSSLKTNID